MSVSSFVFNSVKVASDETAQAVSKVSALAWACQRPGSGVTDEQRAKVVAAFEDIEAAMGTLQDLKAEFGAA